MRCKKEVASRNKHPLSTGHGSMRLLGTPPTGLKGLPALLSGDEGRGTKPRKPGIWNKKTAAPGGSLCCGQRMPSLLLADPAKPRLRQTAPLSVCSGRGYASHPQTKQILSSIPGFPIPSLQSPEVGGVKKQDTMSAKRKQPVSSGTENNICIFYYFTLNHWVWPLHGCFHAKEQRKPWGAEKAMGHKTDKVRFAF